MIVAISSLVIVSVAQGNPQSWTKVMAAGDIPGLSATKVEAGQVKWSVAEGRRQALNREPNAPKVDGDTVFEAGSLGKPIVALAVLSLVERGKLSLDDKATIVLPLPDLKDPRGSEITIRMLLSHSSGLAFAQPRVDAAPGTRFQYSTFGYRYLQQIAESRMGESLEDWATRTLFGPLAMTRSSFKYGPRFEENRAIGRNWLLRGQEYMPNAAGTGAFDLITTSRDYGRLWAGVLSGKVVKPTTLALMFTPQIRITGTFNEPEVRHGLKTELWGGLGLILQRQSGRWIGTQWGDNGGSTGMALMDPAKRNAFVFLTNAEDGVHSAEAVARLGGFRDGVAVWVGYRQAGTPLREAWKAVTVTTDQDPQEGVRAFEAILKKDPKSSKAIARDLGYFHRFRGHVATADPFFRVAADTPEADASMFEDWAESLVLSGKVREAEQVQAKGWEKFPTEPRKASLADWRQAAEADLAKSQPLDPAQLPPLGTYGGYRFELRADGVLALATWSGARPLVWLGGNRYLTQDLAFRAEFGEGKVQVTQAGQDPESASKDR